MAQPPELQGCAPQLCAAGAGTPGLPRLLSCRATLTPFIANHSMGLDTFKWLLFGDDGEQAAHSKEHSAQYVSGSQSMQHIAQTSQGLPALSRTSTWHCLLLSCVNGSRCTHFPCCRHHILR